MLSFCVCVCVQVAVQEEVRSIDSWEYRELCSLYEESQLRMEQVRSASSSNKIYKMLALRVIRQ